MRNELPYELLMRNEQEMSYHKNELQLRQEMSYQCGVAEVVFISSSTVMDGIRHV